MKQVVPLRLLLNHHNHPSLWLWLKATRIYRNGIFTAFTYKKFCALTGVADSCARKHLKYMLQEGWCRLIDGNLHFASINKLKGFDSKGGCVLIPIKDDRNDQITEFRYACIRYNINAQKRRIFKKKKAVQKCRTNQRLTKTELKMVQKAGGEKMLENSLLDYTTLSNKKIGAMFGLQIHSGGRIQGLLRSKRMISTQPVFKVVKRNATVSDYAMYKRYSLMPCTFNAGRKEILVRGSNRIGLTTLELSHFE